MEQQQRKIRLNIYRQDGPDASSRWERFDVPYQPNMNVISCLQWVAAHPVTAEGQPTTPVSWDCSCLEEVCGACTMLINGKVRQSCSALVDNVINANGEILLEPMRKFPVVRDLCVDRQRMFHQLQRIKGWVPIDGLHDLGPGPAESPEQQQVRYALSRCMTCGCCLEACPQFKLDNNFVGAQTIAQVRYFNAHGTGRTLAGERLQAMEDVGGISDCGNAQNCVEVCPQNIPLTEAIGDVNRQVTLHSIRKFFGGR